MKIMKMLSSLLFTGALVVALAGCSVLPAASSAVSKAPAAESSVPESTAAPESSAAESSAAESLPQAESSAAESTPESGAKDPTHPNNAGTESGELPAAQGSADFIAAFAPNALDSAYLEGMKTSSTMASMIEVTQAATSGWETQINYVYSSLTDILEGEEKSQMELEQSAWSNELSLAIEEIQDAAGDGSVAKLDVAYKTMLLFRSRAIALFEIQFANAGALTFCSLSGEVVG